MSKDLKSPILVVQLGLKLELNELYWDQFLGIIGDRLKGPKIKVYFHAGQRPCRRETNCSRKA